MIAFVHGKLMDALPTQVTVDVQGMGYEILIPLSSFDKLPAVGQEVKLLTHLVVREDAQVLYGFVTAAERDLFRLLINTVSGIGPKIALNALSGMSVTAFRGAVAAGDVKSLSQISGVGRKTANVVLNTVFRQPVMAVDTHIFRVANRTGIAPGKDVVEVERKLEKFVPDEFKQGAHHWLILHGRYTCKARKPDCAHCVIHDLCRWPEKAASAGPVLLP